MVELNPWAGVTVGVVVGGESDQGVGGAADKEKAQGLFSLFGHEIWGYIGGIGGLGEKFGPYITTGPMIGWGSWDWGIGAGLHIKRRFGLGLIIPIRAAINASKHSDKLGAYIEHGKNLIEATQNYASEIIANAPTIMQSLDSIISNIC